MSRALFLGTLLFAGPFLSMSLAQNKTEPTQTGPPLPFTKTIFQWDYSCPAGIGCSFVCPGGEASHVIKLSLYLGTVPFDGGQNAPGSVLRIHHEGIAPRERLPHKRWARQFIMQS